MRGLFAIGIAASRARRITTRALDPVRQMAESASEWSGHELGHRFAWGPAHDELTALGETLDRLLDRVARAIRSEQRLTSELAHELRATRGDVEQISASVRAMSQVISTLLDLTREPTGSQARCLPGALVGQSLFEHGSWRRGGTGLGLGISRRVARSRGGEVVFAPGADHVTFTLCLPRG